MNNVMEMHFIDCFAYSVVIIIVVVIVFAIISLL